MERRTGTRMDLTAEDVYELATGYRFFRKTGSPLDLRQAWMAIGEQLTHEHALRLPCSRPWGWFEFVAPEPRRQTAGPVHTMLAVSSTVPQKHFYGRPATHSAADVDCAFERQCDYLLRVGRLTADERRLLSGPGWVCSACRYRGFGEVHLPFDEVKAWFEGIYHA